MSKKELYKGPDISGHNGNVNIKAVRDAGYKRIGIRAGYGKNNVDQKYVVNAEACYRLGVPVLLYWFSYAYTAAMARAEAAYAVAQAKKYWVSCPIAFDFEYDSVNYARKNGVAVNKKLSTDMAAAFLKKVKDAGYLPVLYTNKDYLMNYFDIDRIVKELGQVYIWYARYADNISDKELETADIWQYTSSGKIDGIAGNADLNRFYTDFAEDVPAENETGRNINIQNFQKAANEDGYHDQNGQKLAEDGKAGPKTEYVEKQINLKAKKVTELLMQRSIGKVVEWLQGRLREISGTDLIVTGEYDSDTVTAVRKFQEKYNLKVDGIAGYNTLTMMFYQ